MRLVILAAVLVLAGCAMPRPEECNSVRPAFQAAAEYQMVRVGMNAYEVICAWGRPREINTTTTAYGRSDQWVYETYNYGRSPQYQWKFVYFEDGFVSTVQE